MANGRRVSVGKLRTTVCKLTKFGMAVDIYVVTYDFWTLPCVLKNSNVVTMRTFELCLCTLDMGGRYVCEPGRSRKLPRVTFTLPRRLTMKLPMRPYRGARCSGDGSRCNKTHFKVTQGRQEGSGLVFPL
jgi:hypothetical protein